MRTNTPHPPPKRAAGDEALVNLAFSGDVDALALMSLAPVFSTLETSPRTDVDVIERGLESALGARAASILCDGAPDVGVVSLRYARLVTLVEESAALDQQRRA